jgi:hypothetical protein
MSGCVQLHKQVRDVTEQIPLSLPDPSMSHRIAARSPRFRIKLMKRHRSPLFPSTSQQRSSVREAMALHQPQAKPVPGNKARWPTSSRLVDHHSDRAEILFPQMHLRLDQT